MTPEARPSGAGGNEQPAPKRAQIRLRLDAVQVDKDGNELHSVDEQEIELFDEAAEGFMDCEESEAWDNYDDDAGASPSAEIPSCLIRPFSQTEPQCSPEELQYIDDIADNFELSRLTNMHVLSKVQSKLEDHRVLSSKSVRSWRRKCYPTCTKVGNRWFKLDRMLPGQRDGSVTWFADFTEKIKRAVGAELLPSNQHCSDCQSLKVAAWCMQMT